MFSQNDLKIRVAEAALAYVPNDPNAVIGVGSGSTVNCFIDALANSGKKLRGAIASSEATAARLRAANIAVLDLNEYLSEPNAKLLGVYIDGADEVDGDLNLIKGGGAALTREKIVAAASDKFVCIVDASKHVQVLGQFPLPIEVIPMARAQIARQVAVLGGEAIWRENIVTDNHNVILDVKNLKINHPENLENIMNGWAGVVTVGLFAARKADVVLTARMDGEIETKSAI